MLFKKKIYLPDFQLDALRATNGLLKQRRYEKEIIERSLGSIYKGQQYLHTLSDIVDALGDAQSSLIRQLAISMGYEKGTSLEISLKDGEIVKVIPPEKKEDKKEEKIDIKEHGNQRKTTQEVN